MEASDKVHPTVAGTIAIIGSCLISVFLSFQPVEPSLMARGVSYSLLIGLIVSFLLDWRHGLRNLIRVDVFALLAFYFLTYFEFLFPQSRFDYLVVGSDVVKAVHLTLVGLATFAIARHIDVLPKRWLGFIGEIEMRRGDLLAIYFGAFILSSLPMWLSVEFNPVRWFDELMSPRFGRAWGRGKFGDVSALLHELKLLGYIMPPIAGVIFANRKDYSKFALFFVLITLLTLWFVAFSSGTRNILAIQMAGFLGGFLIIQKRLKIMPVAILGLVIAVTFVFLAEMMLEFRQVGLKRYLAEGREYASYYAFQDEYYGEDAATTDSGYFVDYNLWRIAQMVAAFPELYDYIGWNLPFVAITKPIPRALWPGKPTDLKVGLEEVIGAKGYTIACTWVGEAYVAGGVIWIVATGILIGIFCCFWNQLANFIHSPFPLVVFASGFYSILLLMRSLLFFTTALLPSIALIIMGAFIYKHRRREHN
ncbi:oligosaccharide repeat unit polymerase [Puniceicoccales bacterium CK1056]|uniref:Oligosaccharide repeat unit polymerase n=1 Tax=Oceanipulchritudo coccoides TaxID=2706888 RepID=A0A6B2M1Q0_9BACT|nr:oligosaccharide repeat unit polymerase [Oceanipulchritudo coccoides]NDV62306.1 oligosaccharide repeat unit polymerase [Oceanipulchritudo coccoides]